MLRIQSLPSLETPLTAKWPVTEAPSHLLANFAQLLAFHKSRNPTGPFAGVQKVGGKKEGNRLHGT